MGGGKKNSLNYASISANLDVFAKNICTNGPKWHQKVFYF